MHQAWPSPLSCSTPRPVSTKERAVHVYITERDARSLHLHTYVYNFTGTYVTIMFTCATSTIVAVGLSLTLPDTYSIPLGPKHGSTSDSSASAACKAPENTSIDQSRAVGPYRQLALGLVLGGRAHPQAKLIKIRNFYSFPMPTENKASQAMWLAHQTIWRPHGVHKTSWEAELDISGTCCSLLQATLLKDVD